MSETFYIKKTAFDDNNFDLTQREADSFIIGPGELNGPGGIARDSDLELYGFGSIKWGEGVDQNQYRQLESNACPAKADGDFLPGGADGNTDFLVATHGIVPKSEEDLGIGNGITAPLIGQLWYNTTATTLYNYELTGWETVFSEVDDGLNVHEARTDIHITSDQNTFLDGLILPTLTSSEVNTLNGISLSLGGGTVQGQLDLMVEKAGDTMSGDLIFDSDEGIRLSTTGTFPISFIGIGAGIGDAASSTQANLRINSQYGIGFSPSVTGQSVPQGQNAVWIDTRAGTISARTQTASENLTRKDYVDNNFVADAGGTMDAGADITFSGGEVLGLPATPSVTTAATSKAYVDGAFVADAGGVMDSNADLWFVGGGEVLGLPATPSVTTAATSKAYVDGTFVADAGGTMNSNADITFSGGGEVLGLPDTPSVFGAATSKLYVDTNFVADAGGIMLSGADLVFVGGGQVLGLPNTPTSTTAATSKTYVDTNFVADAGGTMNSNADITFSGGGEVLGLPATPSATAATSKEYVDDEIAALSGLVTIGDYTAGQVKEAAFEPDSVSNASLLVWGTPTGKLQMARDGIVRIRFFTNFIDVNPVSEWEIQKSGVTVASAFYSNVAQWVNTDIPVSKGDTITVRTRAHHSAVVGDIGIISIGCYTGNPIIAGLRYD